MTTTHNKEEAENTQTEADFIKKYRNEELGEYWNSHANLLYWALSYEIEHVKLIKMSKDFLEACPNDTSSAMHRVREILFN